MPSRVRWPEVHGRSASGTFFDCGGGVESSLAAAVVSGLVFVEDGVGEVEDDGVGGGLDMPGGGFSLI